jgi:predicted DNA-binding transcriptional regulator YafY
MQYQRSLEIDRRLQAILGLIRSGKYSTPMLASRLGVSVPTISRDITALRDRGHDIQSERTPQGWRYVLIGKPTKTTVQVVNYHSISARTA